MINEILDNKIEQSKILAGVLKKYTSLNNPDSFENEILLLKKNQINIDGYEIIFHYTVSTYSQYKLENLQMYSVDFPVLPFSVIVKFAKIFYRDMETSFLETEKESKKVYCWIVLENEENKETMHPVTQYSEKMEYDGYKFNYIKLNMPDFIS
jgi:broad specificity polyphosphatase/5'/3'-nucleotidase SurE